MSDEALTTLLSSTAPRAAVVVEDVDAAFLPIAAAAGGSGSGGAASSQQQQPQQAGVTYSGLLNALDSLVAAESRLLFLTTNDASSLPPALVRPGRVDVRVAFGPADAQQAARLFRRFYASATAADGNDGADVGDAQLRALADAFAAAVPPGRFSMAALQGHLLRHRRDAREAVRTALLLAAQDDAAPPALPNVSGGQAAARGGRGSPASPTPPPPRGTPMQLRRRASAAGGQ
jgi:chaperone BCS1